MAEGIVEYICVWFCADADTMQWTIVELCGSAPQSRLDFASCTLRLRLSPTSSRELSRAVYSGQTGNASALGQTAVVQRSGSSFTVSYCFVL